MQRDRRNTLAIISDLEQNEDGTFTCWVWNENFKELHVGEWYGGAEVIRIIHQLEKLGEVQKLERGWKGLVTFSKKPGMIVSEDEPEMVEWYKRLRDKNAAVM